MHFKDKIVWITGASSGIGAELALQLSSQKAKLILTARNEEALKQVQQKCLQQTLFCKIVGADLSKEEEVDKSVTIAMQQFGRIDIVFLNAGVTQRSLSFETDTSVYRYLMEINFFAPVIITQKLFPYFKQQGSGHFVAMSSVAGLIGFPYRSGYAAAKHALMGYFETLQTEDAVEGVNYTIISPGRINTPISASALTKDGSPHLKNDIGQLVGIPVEKCVHQILKAVENNKKHIIIARGEYWLWVIKKLMPALFYKIAHKKGMNN
jgi:dehydrogenase/reductase SDR family protein 7B